MYFGFKERRDFMAKSFEPFSKKQAIDIYASYYGVSKAEAARSLGKNLNAKEVANSLKEMQKGMQMQAQKSFYED